jgi:ribokinase
MKSWLLVVGSLNMDFVVSVPELPGPGETTLGSGFEMIPGGKGANQACAAGKLARALNVRMAGRVGYDLFADHLRASLAAAGVDVSAVSGTKSEATGVAMIWVDRQGQNSIVVAPGANGVYTPVDVEALAPAFAQARIALFQLETPLETVAAGLTLARKHGAITVLDPAPAQSLTPELLALVDVLTPNETEAAILLGRPPSRIKLDQAAFVARELRAFGSGAVLLKMGDRGCYYLGPDFEGHIAPFQVEAKDSTAAGDVFNAAFAVAVGEGLATPLALRMANAAAAISVTRRGAQASIPTRDEVDALLAGIIREPA